MGRIRQSRRRPRATAGYSLVELVTVIAITGVVALVPAQVLLESMRTYARIAPLLDAAYQARLATERLKRDFRDLGSRGSLTVMQSDAVTFEDLDGDTLVYSLSDAGDLTRNGDLLAQDVSALTLTYRDAAGAETASAALVNLLEIDLTVTIAGQSFRQREAAYPRSASDASGPIDEAGSVATADIDGNHFDFDLISLSDSALVIDSFEVSADREMTGLHEFKIDGNKIYKDSHGTDLPTGVLSPNQGDVDDRTLAALSTTDAQVKFKANPSSGDSVVTLVLHFTDGSSATLAFPLSW